MSVRSEKPESEEKEAAKNRYGGKLYLMREAVRVADAEVAGGVKGSQQLILK